MEAQKGMTLTEKLLQLISRDIKSNSGSTIDVNAIIEAISEGNFVVGSGINVDDINGPGTSPFDSGLKLRYTEDDESTGITYIGYATPDMTTSTANGFLIQKIVLTKVGSVETNSFYYTVDSWDNRATATYHPV